MQEYQSQHYNPQVYLRRFTKKKNVLWEYNLTNGSVTESTPKDCACEDFYHSIALENGERDDTTIEQAFGPLESRLPGLFKAIRSVANPLSDELWQLFFAFAAIQYSRSPRNVHKVHDFLSEIHQARFEVLCRYSADFKKRLAEHGVDPLEAPFGFEMQASQGSALLLLLQAVEKVAKVFSHMNWSFLCAPQDKFFVTSDRPVCCWIPSDKCSLFPAGLKHRDMEITFPLSRTICAFGCWESPFLQLYYPISADAVNRINGSTISHSWHFVYGPVMDARILQVVKENAKSRRGVCHSDEIK